MMMKTIGVCAAALAIATPALAETAAEVAADDGLVDIVVTAQKRETNLQTTPIAISVVGAEDLTNRSVVSLADLAGAVPSLRIQPFFSRSSALSIGIRGIVPGDSNQPSRDAGVGVYIDGVYLGRSQGLGTALFDVERIEVLKGPQGTLFGRNATGGALSIVSRKPSGEFGFRQTVGIRNFGGYTAETRIDLPRVGDFSLKVDGVLARRGGTVENTLDDEEDFNGYERRGIRGALLWEPGADVEALLAADYSYDSTTPYYVQLLEKNPAAPALAPLVQLQSDRVRTVDVGVPQDDNVGKTWGVSLHMDWKAADALTLRSISAYREVDQDQLDNGIGAHSTRFVPNGQFSRYSLATLRQEQYSQELQLIGSLPRFEFVAGGFYYHEKGDDDAWSPNTLQWNATGTAATRLPSLGAGAATPFPDRASTAETDSYALFGQATWTPPILGDALKLTGGARYTHDKKKGVLTKVNGANTNFRFNASYKRVDPMVTIALDPTPEVHLYGKWGTAYRAGGANSRSATYRSYGPEEVSTYEIGAKTDLFDRRVRINLAAYTTRYSDIQIDFSAVGQDPLNPNRGTLETVNAPGRGRIKGIEADIAVAPARGLRLTAAYAYTKATLPLAANPFNGQIQQVFVVYTPRNAYSAAIDYSLPVRGEVTLDAHLDAAAADGHRALGGESTLTDKSFFVNGRLTLAGIPLRGTTTLTLAAWSRNLFNDEYTFVESRAAFAAIGTYGIFNEPRTFGVDATVRF